MSTHNPSVLRTDPANGVIMEHGGKRFLTGGRSEVWVSVDGVEQWREARYEDQVVSQLWSRRGCEETRAPALKPVLREGEWLAETIDGRLFIHTLRGGGQ